MISVSVVIPVFNAAKYLEECLGSVLSQTLDNIEIICINDGSTDDSLEILQKKQNADKRITILNQQNSGVSAARNAGVDVAVGKYIGFVDGDDTIDPSFFQKLYNAAEKKQADSVYSKLYPNQSFIHNELLQDGDIKKILLPEFFKGDEFNSVCNKIFLNKIVKESQIKFPEKVKHGEDAQFNIEFLIRANRVTFLNYCGYKYREVEGSATRNIAKGSYLETALEVYKKDWRPVIFDAIDDDKMAELKKIRFANNIISLLYNYAKPKNGLTLKERFSKLKTLTSNSVVQTVFSDKTLKDKLNLSSYKNTIFDEIKNKSVFKLYLLTIYSYYKNK